MTLHIAESLIIDIPKDILADHPHLKSLANRLSMKYVHREVVTEDDLKTVGSQLWDALGIAADFDAARDQAGTKILPLVLRSDVAAILSLPWECLFHPEFGFLGKHDGFTLSRLSEVFGDTSACI